jgi:hypothetical protein
VFAECLITSPQDGDKLGKGAHDITDLHSLEEEIPCVEVSALMQTSRRWRYTLPDAS